MLCTKPHYNKAGKAHGCGQCRPCRFNTRRIWMHRIMLEAGLYSDNAFVGLSYDDDHLPLTPGGVPTLNKTDYREFLNRLRTHVAPHRFRFYIVGEYGDETHRPHHHVALFNFPTCERGRTRRRPGSNRPIWNGCCSVCTLVGTKWGKGDVDLGILEPESAQYICGYVTKKMTKQEDPRLPPGALPEYSKMSLRPGVGHAAIKNVAASLMASGHLPTQVDVPSTLRHGSRNLPLGRYLVQTLRESVGRDKKSPLSLTPTPETYMYAMSIRDTSTPEEKKQKLLNIEAKQRIYKSRRQL